MTQLVKTLSTYKANSVEEQVYLGKIYTAYNSLISLFSCFCIPKILLALNLVVVHNHFRRHALNLIEHFHILALLLLCTNKLLGLSLALNHFHFQLSKLHPKLNCSSASNGNLIDSCIMVLPANCLIVATALITSYQNHSL
jgi:hypothetical protein